MTAQQGDAMIEDTTDYEYRIPDHSPNIIQVRPKRDTGHNPMNWRLYMNTDSPDDAQRILALLTSDQAAEGMVSE